MEGVLVKGKFLAGHMCNRSQDGDHKREASNWGGNWIKKERKTLTDPGKTLDWGERGWGGGVWGRFAAQAQKEPGKRLASLKEDCPDRVAQLVRVSS